MRHSKAGLSLLEMLVALALMAVIGAGLAVSLNLGVQAFDRVGRTAQLQPELALRARLRVWLASAASPDRLSNISLNFEGTAQRLSFVTFAPTPFAPDAAATRITVMLGDQISLRADTLRDDGEMIERFEGTLAGDAKNAILSYYDTSTDPPGWFSDWPNHASLPVLVRITVDEGSTPEWPEMTVRLQHATDQ